MSVAVEVFAATPTELEGLGLAAGLSELSLPPFHANGFPLVAYDLLAHLLGAPVGVLEPRDDTGDVALLPLSPALASLLPGLDPTPIAARLLLEAPEELDGWELPELASLLEGLSSLAREAGSRQLHLRVSA